MVEKFTKEQEERFVSKAGELEFTPAQCFDCISNTGHDCQKYGEKPRVYLIWEEICPEKEKETPD